MPEPPDKDCVRPACSSKADALRAALGGAQRRAASGASGSAAGGGGSGSGGGTMAAGSAAAAGGKSPADRGSTCPADRDELGRQSWTLLHSMAAYYPEVPTAAQRSAAVAFLHALGALYPCEHCAEDLRADLAAAPPRAGSRAELSVWMCELHNRVNAKLGKPLWSCDLKALDARWLDGGARCNDEAPAA